MCESRTCATDFCGIRVHKCGVQRLESGTASDPPKDLRCSAICPAELRKNAQHPLRQGLTIEIPSPDRTCCCKTLAQLRVLIQTDNAIDQILRIFRPEQQPDLVMLHNPGSLSAHAKQHGNAHLLIVTEN